VTTSAGRLARCDFAIVIYMQSAKFEITGPYRMTDRLLYLFGGRTLGGSVSTKGRRGKACHGGARREQQMSCLPGAGSVRRRALTLCTTQCRA
jgi:hypothetical protein